MCHNTTICRCFTVHCGDDTWWLLIHTSNQAQWSQVATSSIQYQLLKNALCTCLKHHKHITYTKTEAVNEEVHIQASSKTSALPSTHIQDLEMLQWLYSNVHYNLQLLIPGWFLLHTRSIANQIVHDTHSLGKITSPHFCDSQSRSTLLAMTMIYSTVHTWTMHWN
jgi:hypothetical protein